MKRLCTVNDDQIVRQVARTRNVWQPRLGHELSDHDTRQIVHNMSGFISVLAEWARAEKLAVANDAGGPTTSNDGEARDER